MWVGRLGVRFLGMLVGGWGGRCACSSEPEEGGVRGGILQLSRGRTWLWGDRREDGQPLGQVRKVRTSGGGEVGQEWLARVEGELFCQQVLRWRRRVRHGLPDGWGLAGMG